jgi:hypothetical protein
MPALPHPRRRFAVWTAAVLVLLVGQLVWLFLLHVSRSKSILIGGTIALLCPLVLIVVLLTTTPPNAIKLQPRTSRWIILGGAALLQLTAAVLFRSDRACAWCVASVGLTLVLLFVLRTKSRSAWWAVLFAWNPLVVIVMHRVLI